MIFHPAHQIPAINPPTTAPRNPEPIMLAAALPQSLALTPVYQPVNRRYSCEHRYHQNPEHPAAQLAVHHNQEFSSLNKSCSPKICDSKPRPPAPCHPRQSAARRKRSPQQCLLQLRFDTFHRLRILLTVRVSSLRLRVSDCWINASAGESARQQAQKARECR